jgi:prepilin-type N-terminal cleavage/methylation domain-containing protein
MNSVPRLSDARGFTLMELVMAMAIGMIVLLAAFLLIDRAFIGNKTISDREDALQRGRNTLEQVTRQLRSQVCVNNTNPITSGQDNSMTFYTYMKDPTSGGSQNPEQHTLSFSGSTLTETDYTLTGTNPIAVSSTPYRTAKLTNAAQVVDPNTSQNIPIFQYYKFDPTATSGTGAYVKLTTPLSSSDQGLVAKITVSFVVRPTGISATDPRSTTFQDDVYWRSADPDNPGTLPCAPTS